MQIPAFSIQNQRAIRLASCDNLPPVMVLTGPNGCGKSTLLNGLRGGGGGGRTLYVGPHRTSRRQQVRMRFLSQNRIDMSSLLSSPNLPSFEGIHLPSSERDAWNYDEAQSYLKFSLCQIELDRQAAIAQRYDSEGHVDRATMPDVWEPLRNMTHNLLPHLAFKKIDVSNRDQVRCLWEVHSKEVLVDIDDLSSGEKAVIQLFFPLIEHHVTERLALMRKTPALEGPSMLAVLMDEPELHLHPNLQGKVLEYIRGLALSEGVQFILATHSPIIVEQATSEELYLLRPAELTPGNDNQLIRISSDEDRLQLMREVFGSTSNVTAMRKVLVVEGKTAFSQSRRSSDARIYGFLSDRFGQLSIVAGGGRSECQAVVRRLNEVLKAISPSLQAVALLDRDVDANVSETDEVRYLPVSMIENLLIDPVVIWEALTTVRHKLQLVSVSGVEAALDAICNELEGHEEARRIKAAVPARTFRLHDPVVEAQVQVETFAAELLASLTPVRLDELTLTAKAAVSVAKKSSKRREFFDGKEILDRFYKTHLHGSGMSKEIFLYECARQASRRNSVSTFVTKLLTAIGIHAGGAATAGAAHEPAQVSVVSSSAIP